MQVPNRQRVGTHDEYRPCSRRGVYLYTDSYGERWLFCRQHFDAAQRGAM